MNNVSAKANDSYQDYLISRLQDPHYAAIYLETHLEEAPEPELLKLALQNIWQALAPSRLSPDKAEQHHKQIDAIFAYSGSHATHALASWLNDLGLKLTVIIHEREQE